MIMNWRKATYSLSNGNCVEVGAGAALVAIRDSQDPDGPAINLTPREWTEFTEYVKRVTSRHRGRDVTASSLCAIAAGRAGQRQARRMRAPAAGTGWAVHGTPAALNSRCTG